MLMNVWYPAAFAKQSDQATVQNYLNLFAHQVDFNNDQSVKEFGLNDFVSKSNMLPGSDSTFNRDQLDLLLPLKGYAAHNAEELPGPFPLIVFPNGMAPLTTHITGEYLASHGYVVVSMLVKGESTSTIDVTAKGIEHAVRDIDFVLSHALTWPNVNREKIGLMGNAIESSFITSLQNRNPLIKSLVSLEGGLLSSFEQRLLNETLFYTPEAVNVPLLAIYAPHPAIDPKHIEHLEYTDRYFAHFPGMTEFHFLSYGMYEPITPGIIGPTRGDTQKGFAEAHGLMKNFFDFTLKQSEVDFEEYLGNRDPSIIDTAFVLKAKPPSTD